jgi:hypothetical protein
MYIMALFTYTAVKWKDPAYPQDACLTTDMLLEDRSGQVSKEDFEAWYASMWATYSIRGPFVPSPLDNQDNFENEKPSINLKYK